MDKGTYDGEIETEREGVSVQEQSKCSVNIVFSEEAKEDVLSSSMGALEKQYAEKSIMR